MSRRYLVVGHALKQDVAHCERALIKDARLRLMYFLKLVQHAIYIMASKAGGGQLRHQSVWTFGGNLNIRAPFIHLR